jgi:outer membrane autotransporter protein
MGVEGEAGFRTNSLGFGLDLGAGLAYVRTKVDGFSAGGIGYDFERGKSLRGRLGARGEFGGSLGVFADARLYHEFEGDNELTLTSGTERDSVEIEGRGTWARFETGFGSRMKAGPMLSAWVDVGDVTGLGIRGGFRF